MDHDTYNLQNLAETATNFLKVNDFDLKKEPDWSKMDNRKFIKVVKKRMNSDNDLFRFMDEVKLDITFRSSLSGVYESKTEKGLNILIFFYPDETLRTKGLVKEGVKKFFNLMLKMNCTEGVLISERNLASTAKKEFNRCNMDSNCSVYNVIFYNDKEFIDIVDHISTPKVIRIYRTPDEIEEFKRENQVKIENLSSIQLTDPLTRFYRGKLGNIFMIKRTLPVSNIIQDFEIVLRIVVPPKEV